MAHGIQVTVVIRQCPGLGLVEPHQGGFEANGAIQPQGDRLIECLDELVAAIGVAGKVGLAHPGDHRLGAHLIGVNGGQGQEQDVAPRYEGIGQAVILQLTAHRNIVPGQGRDGELPQHGDVHHLVGGNAKRPGQPARGLYLRPVALAVIEGDGVHFVIKSLSLHQTGGAVLSSTEYHDGFFHVHHSSGQFNGDDPVQSHATAGSNG